MFDIAVNTLDDVVNGTVTMAGDLLKGELNSRKIMKLVNAGVTVFALSEATGIAVHVLQNLVDSYEDTA